MQNSFFDTIVVGGGIIGITTALELQSRGKAIAVVDPSSPLLRSSYGNGGVISRGSIFPVAGPGVRKHLLRLALGQSPEVRIRYRALVKRPSWLRLFLKRCNEAGWRDAATALDLLQSCSFDMHTALADLVGTRHLLSRAGWIKLYRSDAAFDATALERQILASKRVQTEILDKRRLHELEPNLAPRFARGIWFPETGAVDGPDLLVQACHNTFRSRGGTLIAGKVLSVRQEEDKVSARLEHDRLVTASSLVVAAGAWSSKLTSALGYKIPLGAERGYHRHYRNPEVGPLNRPVLDTEGGFAMIPIKGSLRLLSGVEFADPDAPPNYTQIDSLLPDAKSSFAFRDPLQEDAWVGSRPSTPDGIPVICRAPRHDRLFFAFGHGHVGFSTGPITGRIVASLITGSALPFDISAFDLRRFS